MKHLTRFAAMMTAAAIILSATTAFGFEPRAVRFWTAKNPSQALPHLSEGLFACVEDVSRFFCFCAKYTTFSPLKQYPETKKLRGAATPFAKVFCLCYR